MKADHTYLPQEITGIPLPVSSCELGYFILYRPFLHVCIVQRRQNSRLVGWLEVGTCENRDKVHKTEKWKILRGQQRTALMYIPG